VGSVVGHLLAKRSGVKRTIPLAALCLIIAISSVRIAGNDSLISRKIVEDRRLAEDRVRALYDAATSAAADRHDLSAGQDPMEVRGHYKGPSFSEEEWEGMTRNLLRRNGYVYQIHLSQEPPQGILVYALPIAYYDRVKEGLCLDDSGKLRCPLKLISRQACVPCAVEK
jgi:hypothetical protein